LHRRRHWRRRGGYRPMSVIPCGHCRLSGCHLCHLYLSRADYRQLWGTSVYRQRWGAEPPAIQAGRIADPPRDRACRHLGAVLDATNAVGERCNCSKLWRYECQLLDVDCRPGDCSGAGRWHCFRDCPSYEAKE
jgi:hypothetical protein